MIHLTREVRFSAAGDPAAPVLNAWAGWPAPAGLAPYLKLQATVAGEPDPHTGYLCNIKLLDDLLRARAVPLALELLAGRGGVTAERFLRAAWARVASEGPY